MNGQSGMEADALTQGKQTASGKLLYNRDLNWMLCDNLEGWDEGEAGGKAQEGRAICILMADSHCCMAETNTML